jgi:hypothetical protein
MAVKRNIDQFPVGFQALAQDLICLYENSIRDDDDESRIIVESAFKNLEFLRMQMAEMDGEMRA